MECLRKYWLGEKGICSTLEKRHQKYFLRFLYRRSNTYQNTCERTDYLQCGLRINTDAVCTNTASCGQLNCLGEKIHRLSQ